MKQPILLEQHYTLMVDGLLRKGVIRMAKAKTTKLKLDVMSITVILVIAIFGGILGYYIGQEFGINQGLYLSQSMR